MNKFYILFLIGLLGVLIWFLNYPLFFNNTFTIPESNLSSFGTVSVKNDMIFSLVNLKIKQNIILTSNRTATINYSYSYENFNLIKLFANNKEILPYEIVELPPPKNEIYIELEKD